MFSVINLDFPETLKERGLSYSYPQILGKFFCRPIFIFLFIIPKWDDIQFLDNSPCSMFLPHFCFSVTPSN